MHNLGRGIVDDWRNNMCAPCGDGGAGRDQRYNKLGAVSFLPLRLFPVKSDAWTEHDATWAIQQPSRTSLDNVLNLL